MADETKSSPTMIDWTARSERPRRSVFRNYRAGDTVGVPPSGDRREAEGTPVEASRVGPAERGTRNTLQSAIDVAMARSFIYAFLSRAFEDPNETTWQWLCAPATAHSLHSAWLMTVGEGDAARCREPALPLEQFDSFHADYLAAFGHAARGRCPLNEIEYGDIKADPLFQPHRLADLAAFYRAFGLEVADDAAERHDHICLELEFMSVLAAREAYALEHQADPEHLAVCRDAQRKFLREHPGRWLPAFTRRLVRTIGEGPLAALAGFTREFIVADCARFEVSPGSDDLLLRPADSAGGSLCDACGLGQSLPGAR